MWSGYISVGDYSNGRYKENTAVTRQLFTFTDIDALGYMRGLNSGIINFGLFYVAENGSDPSYVSNNCGAYGFYVTNNKTTDVVPVMIYRIPANYEMYEVYDYTVRPESIVVDCINRLTADGLPMDSWSVAFLSGMSLVNGGMIPLFEYSDAAISNTATAAEEVLLSYTVPANSLQPKDRLRVRAFGTTTGTTDSKNIRIRPMTIATTSVAFIINSAVGQLNWRIDMEMNYLDAGNTLNINYTTNATTLSTSGTGTSLSIDPTIGLPLLLTSSNPAALAASITLRGFTVDIIKAAR